MRPLALVVLLAASPVLAGDRPERVSDAVVEPAFVAEQHPVATALLVSGAAVTAVVLVAVAVLTIGNRNRALQFPSSSDCIGCR